MCADLPRTASLDAAASGTLVLSAATAACTACERGGAADLVTHATHLVRTLAEHRVVRGPSAYAAAEHKLGVRLLHYILPHLSAPLAEPALAATLALAVGAPSAALTAAFARTSALPLLRRGTRARALAIDALRP